MASFGDCINWVLRLEDRTLAGKTVNLGDGAGYTRFGVTSVNCTQVPENFWIDTVSGPRMTNEEALEVAKQVYHDRYWQPLQGSQMTNDEVAATLLSIAVNCGVVAAVRLLQGVLSAPADGVLGPITLARVTAYSSQETLAEDLRETQEAYYQAIVARKPENARFLNGWLNRARARYPDLP